MRRQTRIATAWATALATLGLAAYGGASESHATTTGDDLPRGSEPVTLDPADFTVEVDNPYWPMRPGSTWVYRGTDTTGTLQRIVITVTDETKAIANGVEARVVHDVVTESGTPVEITDDWYAQDKAGNVWYLGEDVRNYENGKLADREGSFEAGVDGAQPGIVMPAEPRAGQHYRQEFLEGEAEDQGAVLSADELVEAPAGRYDHAVLTRDTNPLEPEVSEYKLYARDVGLVLTLDVSGGTGREELLSVDEAGPDEGTGPLGSP
jgi:hypothetical protein